MDDIDKMSRQFQSIAELQMYADAQNQTIISLSKKINQLQEECKDLKKQLLNSTPKEVTEENSIIESLKVGTDYEVIAKIQLNKYKEVAMDRELSLEETKKVEILTKVLFAGKEKKSEGDKGFQAQDALSNDELMALIGKL